MRHLQKFNEAIIEKGKFGVSDLIKELIGKMARSTRMPISTFGEIAKKFNVEVVDYKTFLEDLPEDQRSTAPEENKQQIPIFGLVNPETNNIRIVACIEMIDQMTIPHLITILNHESIHKTQISKRNLKYVLPDPKDPKSYFSNKDEIMAFSQSISEMQMQFLRVRSAEEGVNKLDKNPLYNTIKRAVDNEVLKRYKKYIYLYLQKEFSK